MKMIKITLAFVLTASVALTACKKEARMTTLKINMTDAPAAWDEVNVDLQQVTINFNGDSSAWIPLETKAGVYNLLGLQNGLDTLIAQGTFPTNTVNEIRLVLGDNNTIKVDGQTYPLTIPSGETSGFKIKVNRKLHNTIDSLLIDFDAALSITQETDGYKLRPVITLK
jgi:Domain of unknown function (DUF4382)